MPILCSSDSAANTDIMSETWDKWGYNYLIQQKTMWEKQKLLVTSNFSFSYNVFKSCLLLVHQNDNLWSKGLKLQTVWLVHVIVVFAGRNLIECFESFSYKLGA